MFAVRTGGNHRFPRGLIPTGATVHSHCEIGLIKQMKAEVGVGGHVDKKNERCWTEEAGEELPNIHKNGLGAHLVIMVIASS